LRHDLPGPANVSDPNSINNTATQAMIQPAATSGSPSELASHAVDQALTATTATRGRLRKIASNDAAVDDLFRHL
jgi:hypothetical protein